MKVSDQAYQHAKSIQELKRLQKEIDEAEVVKTKITSSEWLDDYFEPPYTYNDACGIIEQNQQRIKQIIESL